MPLLDINFKGVMLIIMVFLLVALLLTVIFRWIGNKLLKKISQKAFLNSFTYAIFSWLVSFFIALTIMYFLLAVHYRITGKGLLE